MLRAPWKKVTITPVDISVKTRHSEELVERIAESPTAVAQYIKEFHRTSPARRRSRLGAVDLHVGRDQRRERARPRRSSPSSARCTSMSTSTTASTTATPSPGSSISSIPPDARKAWVQFDLDLDRFYDLYAELMMRQATAD